MPEDADVAVHFHFHGHVYRGVAQFDAGWNHIKVLGRLIKTGGWDYGLAYRKFGDDKFAITAEQLEELKQGRSVQTEWADEILTIEPGEYSPSPGDRSQGELFGP